MTQWFISLIVPALLVIVIGGIAGGLLAVVMAWRLNGRVRVLERRLAALEGQGTRGTSDSATPRGPAAASAEAGSDTPAAAPPASGSAPEGARSHSSAPRQASPLPAPVRAAATFLRHLVRYWMVWLGGASIALAGIFLVRYSVEQGYLGPGARIGAGLALGLGLHAAAEWLRRHTAFRSEAVAALAGSASLVLYAAVLAALHLYGLWSAAVAFALLGLISLVTQGLALMHGPVLAVLGILGGFAVPALIGGESISMAIPMAYALVIAVAGMALMVHVFRPWLWWGLLVGAGFWWWLGVHPGGNPADLPLAGLYLAVLAWAMLALPDTNPSLGQRRPDTRNLAGWGDWLTLDTPLHTHRLYALALLLPGLGYGLMQTLPVAAPAWPWLALPAVILWAAHHDRALRVLPWPALLASLAGVMAATLQPLPGPFPFLYLVTQPLDPAYHTDLFVLLAAVAGLFGVSGLWTLRARRRAHEPGLGAGIGLAASQAFLAPLLALAVAARMAPDALSWPYAALAALGYGALLLSFAGDRLRRERTDAITGWLVVAGHLGWGLAAILLFERAGLTLALAVPLVSLVWVRQRFGLTGLDWLIRAVLLVLAVRLTLMPWLPGHAPESHWIPGTFGGALLLALLGARLVPASDPLRRWLEAGSLHLLVLFLFTGLRYLLYGGDVFIARFDFPEAAIQAGLWAALALIQFGRSQPRGPEHDGLDHALAPVHRVAARILMGLALSVYLYLAVTVNPLFVTSSNAFIGERPVFNLLVVAYGVPIIFWLLGLRLFESAWRPLLGWMTGLGAWLFVTLQVRHLWHDGQVHWSAGWPDGELYSYSLAWLLMALAALIGGIQRDHRGLYRAGLILLVGVILKVFLVDLAGLTGVLRALSFMGLGLVLLGTAYLHQRLARHSGA